MTTQNTLNYLTKEYPELLYATMDSAQETHELSNTFACYARAPTPESLIQTEQTEDQPTETSDTRLFATMIAHYQV